MNIVEEVKKYASLVELQAANFLDSKGEMPEDKRKIVKVQLIFIDGKEFMVSIKDFEQLENVQFMLRPTRDDG